MMRTVFERGMIVLHEHPAGCGVYVFVTSTKVCAPPDMHSRRRIKSHRPSFSKTVYSKDGLTIGDI